MLFSAPKGRLLKTNRTIQTLASRAPCGGEGLILCTLEIGLSKHTKKFFSTCFVAASASE